MNAGSAIAAGFGATSDFSGELPRKLFWLFLPAALALPLVAYALAVATKLGPVLTLLCTTVAAIPFISAATRRLRHAGRRVWPAPAMLVPVWASLGIFWVLLNLGGLNGSEPDGALVTNAVLMFIFGGPLALFATFVLLIYTLVACAMPGLSDISSAPTSREAIK